jgi:phosphoribosylformylglycinamidine synthase
VVLLGETREELGGSEWLRVRRGLEAGLPPAVDLAHERRLQRLLAEAVARGLVRSAHDVADGGLAVALAESTFAGPEGLRVGATVALPQTLRVEALLFGESTGRVVVTTVDPSALGKLAAEHGVPARPIGATGGGRLRIGPEAGVPWIDLEVARLEGVWARALPRRLEEA